MPDIRADFSRSASLRPEEFQWVPSPGGEVERVMLDRVGDEVAVATSLVRYPPASRFPAHEHGLGEEFLVLEGEFGDEHGRYPPGTYVRNPPASRHTPFSDPGCVIWVKLRQFHPDDGTHLVAALDDPLPDRGSTSRTVHRFGGEVVSLILAAAGSGVALPALDLVQELLVVEGRIVWRERERGPWSWVRVPAGEGVELTATGPARLLHKTRPAFAIPRGPANGATSAASEGR